MRKLFITVLLAVTSLAASAQYVVENKLLGPGNYEIGSSPAFKVLGDLYHVPQFMPGYPTSATIWPRVTKTKCRFENRTVYCDPVRLTQYGDRTEYLFFTEREKPTVETLIDNLSVRVDQLYESQKELDKKLGEKKSTIILLDIPEKNSGN